MPPKTKPFRKKQDSTESKELSNAPNSPPNPLNRAASTLGSSSKQPPQDRAVEYIRSGNTEALRALLEEGSDLSFLNRYHSKYGKHALVTAAEEGRIEATEILLQIKVVDLEMRDNFEMSPVLYAAKEGQNEILGLLIQFGANPNIEYVKTNENGLHLATQKNNVETVQFLIEREVPCDKQNLRLETPLSIAIKYEFYEIAELLLSQGCDINVRRTLGDSPLFAAVFDNRLQTVNYILQHGGRITHRNDNGETALMVACKHSSLEVVQVLLDAGADINAVDNGGRSALFIACMIQKAEIASYLLNRFANIHLKDVFGYTALSIGCRISNGSSEIISLLIRFKAELNAMDNCYNTPIHHACSKNNMDICVMLLKAGANPFLKNLDGKLPVDLLDRDSSKDFLNLSIESYSKGLNSSTLTMGAKDLPPWVQRNKNKTEL
jgi:ankyrin repeat protein